MPTSDDSVTDFKLRNIQLQVTAEHENRNDLLLLATYEQWLKVEHVEEDLREKMIAWVKEIVAGRLQARMQTKTFLEQGLEDALTINRLQHD